MSRDPITGEPIPELLSWLRGLGRGAAEFVGQLGEVQRRHAEIVSAELQRQMPLNAAGKLYQQGAFTMLSEAAAKTNATREAATRLGIAPERVSVESWGRHTEDPNRLGYAVVVVGLVESRLVRMQVWADPYGVVQSCTEVAAVMLPDPSLQSGPPPGMPDTLAPQLRNRKGEP